MASAHIRRARASDMPALTHICLVTGDAGNSGEGIYANHELLGNVYALPYVGLPERAAREAKTWAFVLVSDEKDEVVVGYVLGTADTRTFERVTEAEWYPPLQQRFPLSLRDYESSETGLKDADKRIIGLFHKPDRTSDESIAYSPAHLHIDILPSYQRKGWGKRLIGAAVEELKGEGIDAVTVGLDPRNEQAVFFYTKVGFKPLEGVPGKVMGLRFEDFQG